jgi:4-aminobutyrate aminotransferase-like enzyme
MIVSNSNKMARNYEKYLFSGIETIPNIINKGKGSFIWDVDGNKILDLNAGQFCSIFGHSWPPLRKVVDKQLNKICHTSTQVVTPEVLIASKKVSKICKNMNGKVIFLSTGSEAVECALRFAKHIKHKSGFVCFDNGYHGLTLGSQSVTFGGKWAFPEINSIDFITAPVFHRSEEHTSELQSP